MFNECYLQDTDAIFSIVQREPWIMTGPTGWLAGWIQWLGQRLRRGGVLPGLMQSAVRPLEHRIVRACGKAQHGAVDWLTLLPSLLCLQNVAHDINTTLSAT